MVCNPDGDLALEILDGVESLVEKSLLRQEGEDEPRFVMLETINEYAAERLDELDGPRGATRRAHADYFATYAHRTWEEISRRGRQAALTSLTPDTENLRTAWRYWVRERDLDALNKLVDALWLLYDGRGWYRAAIQLTGELLDVLDSSPSSPERTAQEITLRTSQGRALLAFEGYTVEVEEAFTRALEAAGGEEGPPQLVPVLRSLGHFYTYRGEFEKGEEVGRALLRLADVQNDASIRADAHLLLGECFVLRDQLHLGLEHLNSAIELSEEQDRLTGRFRVGNNPRVAALTTSALTLWLLGFPDEALTRLNRAVDTATSIGHPSTLAYAIFHTGFTHLWRREPEPARQHALRALAVAEEHDLHLWNAVATFLLGASRIWLAEVEEGLAEMRRGLASYQGLRTPPVFWPMILFVQAEALRRAGMPEEGLAGIDEAVELVGSDAALSPLFFVARGDLLLGQSPDNATDARAWYLHGLAKAGELGARMLQLRAAVGLCRTAQSPDDSRDARDTLAAVVSTFTEGLATPDLRDALDLLRGAPDDTPVGPGQPA
jgi:tetratricopeptide (TPR) repeat protein